MAQGVQMMYWEDNSDLDQLPSMLDYVYNIDDINDKPSVQEYKKLKKIMRIMTRFYEKGSVNKHAQMEDAKVQLKKIEADQKMVQDQIDALAPFPDSHPKKKVFIDNLKEELAHLAKVRKPYDDKVKEYDSLEKWSDGIVDACKWLEATIEDYCNNNLEMDPKLRTKEMDSNRDLMLKHAKGLDEVTFNLQESQDFFDASLDGRLRMFHQLEKCMIEAQIQAISKHDDNNPRKVFVIEDLKKDLEYVKENMEEDAAGKKRQHKERMRELHKDFFRVLRWQRRKLKGTLGIPDIEPENIEQIEATAPKKSLTDMASCPFGMGK